MKSTTRFRATSRFLLWFLWPLGAAAGLSLAASALLELGTDQAWASLVALVLLVGVVVAGFWMVARVFQTLGKLRRMVGWYTKAERAHRDRMAAYQDGFERAADLRAFLTAGGEPLHLTVWDVMLERDETVVMDVPLAYARWYGTDASYTHSSVLAAGRTSFVAGALLGNAIGNAVRRSNAAAAAQTMWRDQETVRTLVTDRRILCRTSSGWLSFWYGGVNASYPDPLTATLVLEFRDAAPLRLHGHHGAAVGVFATAFLRGRDSLRNHPALAALSERQASVAHA